jgi:hypothetical protein
MGTTTPGISGISGGGGDRGGLTMGWLAAFGTGGYDDELPLLEELGVNFAHIKGKVLSTYLFVTALRKNITSPFTDARHEENLGKQTLTVLNPFQTVDQHMMDDSDVAGPIMFCMLFGTFLLLSGKVHFGYIYGVALLGSVSLHILLNLMSPPTHSLNYIRSASVLGYCLLPLVFTSGLGVAYPLDGMLGYLLSTLAIVWSTYAASNMFMAVLGAREMRWLVAYPLALFYSVFGIMSIFGSKASGGLPKL